MTPVLQQIYGENGDCLRACVASILDMEPSKVPHFCDGTECNTNSSIWIERFFDFIDSLGRQAIIFDVGETISYCLSKPYIGVINNGPSKHHAVVMQKGEIIHDPFDGHRCHYSHKLVSIIVIF